MKAVIFDFNGTLFWDSQLHIDAWIEYSKRLRGVSFTVDEMLQHMFGRTNEDILTYALGHKPDKDLLDYYAREKEAYYREMCKSMPEKCELAPHAEEFLDFLKANGVPLAIATMSEWCNVEFYIEQFKLERWFDLKNIVYSDGTLPGKPAPDIYLLAAKRLGIDMRDCVVFEDALSGIDAAKNAGAEKIIAVASREPLEFYKDKTFLHQIITDFNQVDKASLLTSLAV